MEISEAEIGLQDGRPPEISRMWVTMLQLLQDNPLYAGTGHGNGPQRSFILFYFTAELTWRRWELAFASWTGTSQTAEALRRIIDAGAPI